MRKGSKWWSSITTTVVAFAGNGLPIGRWQRVPGWYWIRYLSITVGYLVGTRADTWYCIQLSITVGYMVLEQMWGTTTVIRTTMMHGCIRRRVNGRIALAEHDLLPAILLPDSSFAP